MKIGIKNLVIIPQLREKTLRRLANVQERDEREEYITGKAARATYIATLSLMLFFLFFSLIDINFSKLNQQDKHKPQHSISISAHYRFFSEPAVKSSDDRITTIFDTNQFSLSCATLIFMLLGWQLFIFNRVARKERLKVL